DGIRDKLVTGVQTCALPISCGVRLLQRHAMGEFLAAVDHRDVIETEKTARKDIVALAIDLVHPPGKINQQLVETAFEKQAIRLRSEERRVGKECRSKGSRTT